MLLTIEVYQWWDKDYINSACSYYLTDIISMKNTSISVDKSKISFICYATETCLLKCEDSLPISRAGIKRGEHLNTFCLNE